MSDLNIFIGRLKKIGINLELIGNYPWVYLNKINGKNVKETFQSDYGFVLCYQSIVVVDPNNGINSNVNFSDLTEIFNTIRKYMKLRQKKLQRILK